MEFFDWILRALLGRTASGSEGAKLVGTSTKANLNNATTVEVALAYINTFFGSAVSSTEFGYLDGLTSSVQTQLDAKATTAYVDAAVNGLDWKASCRAATTADITLSGAQTIDGVSVIAGDRVLVKNQSSAADNGIYVAAAGAWARASDANASAEVTCGMATNITEGTANGDTAWNLTTNDPITLGSTSLSFSQYGSLTGVTASSPLASSGGATPNISISNQTANTVLAGATSGGAAAPTFRALVAADLPTGISAANIGDGSVSNTEFQYLDGLSGNIQSQLDDMTDYVAEAVDAGINGLDWKASCRAATTANITLSGAQTIDGVSVIAGNRVLVKNQSTGADNGIYVCASGVWSRATDADHSAELSAGMACFISEGTTLGNTLWILTTNDAITVGSTSLVFAQVGSGGGMTQLSDDTTPDLGGNLNLASYCLVDTNGNEQLKFVATASAVNEWTVTNAATGNPPILAPSGGDSNIDAKFIAKGTGKLFLGSGTKRNISRPADGATITLDLSASNVFMPAALGGNRTIALSNAEEGQAFLVGITQDGTGGRTVTWFSTIKWMGGVAPTLTTTLNKRDWFGFVCTGSGTYDGFVVGANA